MTTVYIGERQSGKTTTLIEMSEKTGATIVVATYSMSKYIQMAAAGVYVGCVKFTTIVIEGTLPHHCADCSFQIHSLSPAQAGTVLLLLPRVTQKHF